MRLSKRDWMATGMVAVALLLYVLWASGKALPNMSGIRATGVAILVLGFLASAMAVVPTFTRLLHGNKAYLAITSLIGITAAVAGGRMLVTASGAALAVLVAATFVLWLIATTHHGLLARDERQAGISEAPPTPDRRPAVGVR